MIRFRRLHGNDRGSVALELVVIAPALLTLIAVIAVGARMQDAHIAVNAAAHDAARAASISRTADQARINAAAAATRALTQGGLRCQSTDVVFTPPLSTAFAVQVGTASPITVRVTCIVPLSDLGVPGVPARKRITAVFTSDLDLYRART